MALTPKLELRQSQQLVMTPQLQQAIKLLQLSNLELSAFVEQELERNPLLERAEGHDDDEAPPVSEKALADEDGSDGVGDDGYAGDPAALELTGENAPARAGEGEGEAPLDADYANDYTNDSAMEAMPGTMDGISPWSQVRNGSGYDDDGYGVEQMAGAATTLKDHLLEQLSVAVHGATERMICAHMIESLDESGYLIEPLEEIAERLGCELAELERLLALIQGFDPPGVFARSLRECLALQLKERDRLDPIMQRFLSHLDLLGRHDLETLQRQCGVDAEDLRDMIAEIRTLNPKPGLAYDFDVAQPVVPDIYVRENPDGGWTVELNTDTLPRVLVNGRYYARINRNAGSKDDRAYLTECMNNANWLVKSLDQRARTILKVASELVRQQDAFFAHGVEHLRPLNLRAIAEAISMHESTVSRVTANKYMATPRGIFELKYFFTSAINATEGGDQHSAESVRHRIRDLIDRETPRTVLSDDKLVDLLRSSGIEIARRTVAKYREAMGIPSSVQRRRMKRMSA